MGYRVDERVTSVPGFYKVSGEHFNRIAGSSPLHTGIGDASVWLVPGHLLVPHLAGAEIGMRGWYFSITLDRGLVFPFRGVKAGEKMVQFLNFVKRFFKGLGKVLKAGPDLINLIIN